MLLAAAWTLLAGCAQPQGSGTVLDPTQGRTDLGTLVDMSDVLEVSQRMVNSLRADPGVSGARPNGRSGLAGLADRVHALDGRLTVDSEAGRGTTLAAELPCAVASAGLASGAEAP